MAGIAGIWNGSEALAQAMLDAMGPRSAAHRNLLAPENGVWLGQGDHETRVSPTTACNDDFVIVLDGRLHTDSGERIEQPGLAVINAYRSQGIAGFAELKGDFAFSLWDPEKQQLICARDALGLRPLFYRNEAHSFSFASEERGLAPLFGEEPLCDLRVAEFLLGICPPIDRGMRPSVYRVEPGTAIIADGDQVRSIVFDALILPAENAEAIEVQARHFHELLRASVLRSCDGEPNVDCFLSGGLDSSTMLSLADSIDDDVSITALSLVDIQRPDRSELPYVEAVLSGRDVESHLFDISSSNPFEGAAEAMSRHAGPFAAPALLMMRPLYAAMRPGAALLDGHGGDEVVSKGEGFLLDLALGRRWFRLYRELQGTADLYGDSAFSIFLKYFKAYGPGRYKIRAVERFISRLFGTRSSSENEIEDFLDRDFRVRSGIDAELERRWMPRATSGREFDLRILSDPQQSYALEVLDREAQEAGVNGRYPFWDRALIDYSNSLPTSAKLQGGWTRFILRQAMSADLPSEVRWRRDKHDFTGQLREALIQSPIVSVDALNAARSRLSPFVDMDRLIALRERIENSEIQVSGQFVHLLWRVGMLAIWTDKRV